MLTPAEWRVVELIRDGMPNAEIAVRLGVSVRTVKSHVTSILAKTDMPDRYALAQWDGVPSEVAASKPRSAARGFVLPLAGWLSGGAAKVVAGGVAAVLVLGAAFIAFGVLIEADEDTEINPTSEPTATVEVTVMPPAVPAPEGSIVYQCGDALCYARLGEGSFRSRLIEEPVRLPSWSPDGLHLAYYTNEGLVVYTFGGQERRVLLELTGVHNPVPPAWSPDGRFIAVEDTIDTGGDNMGGPIEILIVEVSTGEVHRPIERIGAFDADMGPQWSPDGSSLVFMSNRDEGNSEIYVVDLDGSGLTNLTQHEATDWAPVWLADGRIAFFSDRERNSDLFVMDADGDNVRNLTQHPAADVSGAVGHAPPSVLPGSRLGFLSDRGGSGELEPYVVDLATGDVSASEFPVWADAWSADGEYVLFSEDGQLWAGSADGTYRERLNSPAPPGTFASWVPPTIPPGYPPDMRTGESAVDAVIDAVLAGDTDALADLARFEEHPCVLPEHEDYRVPPPPCPEGVSEGTVLEVMVVYGCHPMMVFPADLDNFFPGWLYGHGGMVRIYAVIEGADPASGGEYVALFTVGGELGYGLQALVLGRGGWVSHDGGCRAEMLEFYSDGNEFVLPPLE